MIIHDEKRRMKQVSLSDITPSENLRSVSKMRSFSKALEQGANFPPIELEQGCPEDGDTWVISDGHHRFYANLRVGRRVIAAICTTYQTS